MTPTPMHHNDLVVTAYGLDPSLRHGALVKARFVFHRGEPSDCTLQRWTFVKQWTPKDELSIGEKSSVEEICRLSNGLIHLIDEKAPIGIDWDPTSIFWGQRRLQGVKTAFFMGYLFHSAQVRGCTPVFITPSTVRFQLELPKSADKEETWSTFLQNILYDDDAGTQRTKKTDPYRDGGDALILAYLVARGAVMAAKNANPHQPSLF